MLVLKSFILSCLTTSLCLAQVHEGKALFQEAKCMECHNIEDFGGSSSKVKTYKQMKERVEICVGSTDASWFDEDTQLVVDYLNNTYYKFKKTE